MNLLKKAMFGCFVLALTISAQAAGPRVAHAKQGPAKITPGKLPPVALWYNNTGPSTTNLYSEVNGYLILGPSSPSFGETQYVAEFASGGPQSPATTIHGVALAVEYFNLGDGGTKPWSVQICPDSGGLPSTTGCTAPVNVAATTGDFPSCCAYHVVSISPTVSVPANTGVWVVVNAADPATEDVWPFSNHIPAYNLGSGWASGGFGNETLAVF